MLQFVILSLIVQRTSLLECNNETSTCEPTNYTSDFEQDEREAVLFNPDPIIATLMKTEIKEDSGNYNISVYDEDLYNDFEDDLPEFKDTECAQDGLHCINEMLLVDCDDDFPRFVMSCSNIIETDDKVASGYCDNVTSACVISSQDANLSLPVKFSHEYTDFCMDLADLICVDNKTLVVCTGDSSVSYSVLCSGISQNEKLFGYCGMNSCIVENSTANLDESN